MSAAIMMTDAVLKAAVVRNEISEVLKSERLTLLGSCEAHVFKLEDGKWTDLTSEPVLVHLIRDNLEGMTKMLAVHTHKLVIDNVPVSSNFNVFTPSKKFLQFVCNKFDKNSDNYGFGFTGLSDLEMFMQLLHRIKQLAMASLTPNLYQNMVPPNTSNPAAPFGFTGSPMKSATHPSEYEAFPVNRMYVEEPSSPHGSEIAQSNFSSDKSLDNDNNMPATPSDSHTMMSAAEVDYVDYASNEMSNHSNLSPTAQNEGQSHGAASFNQGRNSHIMSGGGEMPLYSFAERRICDLIASFDLSSSNSQQHKKEDHQSLHSPGPIGSPIKRHHQQ